MSIIKYYVSENTHEQATNLSSAVATSSQADSQQIPVHLTHIRPVPLPAARRTPYNTTIRRDNRTVQALSLPNIMVANHRSMFPKFVDVIKEVHGLHNISTPRINRRGGGAAITLICNSPFTLSPLKSSSKPGEEKLEVCWGLRKPKVPTGNIKYIIICSFYIPPNTGCSLGTVNC